MPKRRQPQRKKPKIAHMASRDAEPDAPERKCLPVLPLEIRHRVYAANVVSGTTICVRDLVHDTKKGIGIRPTPFVPFNLLWACPESRSHVIEQFFSRNRFLVGTLEYPAKRWIGFFDHFARHVRHLEIPWAATAFLSAGNRYLGGRGEDSWADLVEGLHTNFPGLEYLDINYVLATDDPLSHSSEAVDAHWLSRELLSKLPELKLAKFTLRRQLNHMGWELPVPYEEALHDWADQINDTLPEWSAKVYIGLYEQFVANERVLMLTKAEDPKSKVGDSPAIVEQKKRTQKEVGPPSKRARKV